MKCNICGGEMPEGECTCKFCGNVMPRDKNAGDMIKTREIKMPPRQIRMPELDSDMPRRTYRPPQKRGGYCTRCGRPLDGVTNKCIVCEASEVSRRAYENEEYREREMNIMAQKKKKQRKNNKIRNIVLAILAMIIIFTVALMFAFEKLPKWLGIGVAPESDESEVVTVTAKPKNTADPNWKADVNDGKTKKKANTETAPPVRTAEPEPTGDPVDLRGGEYLYPTDTRVISNSELDTMDRADIKLIYWEIYARHGYTFDDDLADYFENNHQWYMPTTSDKQKVEAKFNSVEKQNISVIEAYQKSKNWR